MDNLLTCQCACTKKASVVSFDCMLAMMQSTKLFAWWEPCMDVSHPPSLHPEWEIWRCAHYLNVKRLVISVVIPQLHVFCYVRSALPLVFYPTPNPHESLWICICFTLYMTEKQNVFTTFTCCTLIYLSACLPTCLVCIPTHQQSPCVVPVHVFIGEQIFIILTYQIGSP